jgi:hypothetical protein
MVWLLAAERAMKNEHVISGLLKKRAELAGRIDRHQSELVAMLSDLSAIDSALRIFDPEIDLAEITMKPMPPRHGAARGQMTLLALNVLREANEPLRTEEINRRIMIARGLSTADKPLARMMLERLHSCLRHHRKHGRVRSVRGPGNKFSLWEAIR